MKNNFYTVLPFVITFVFDDRGRLLVGEHPDLKRKPYPKYTDVPGGKLEPDELPEKCAIRELKEETGFEAVSVKLFDVFHHSGERVLSDATNNIESLGLCYLVREYTGKFTPAELNNMSWEILSDILKRKKVTPWTRYIIEKHFL